MPDALLMLLPRLLYVTSLFFLPCYFSFRGTTPPFFDEAMLLRRHVSSAIALLLALYAAREVTALLPAFAIDATLHAATHAPMLMLSRRHGIR